MREGRDGTAPTLIRLLPDHATPYVSASPVQVGDGFVRRTYASGDRRVEITVARMGGTAPSFEAWVTGSRDFPQLVLPVAPDQANGFFTCASEAVCDVHIQFRSGFHVEGMGNGRVPKADLIHLLANLPLATLADASVPTI